MFQIRPPHVCTGPYFIVRASMNSFVDGYLAFEKFENCEDSPAK